MIKSQAFKSLSTIYVKALFSTVHVNIKNYKPYTEVTTTLFTPTYMSQGFKNMSATAISAATNELEFSAISRNIKESDITVAAI